MKELQRFSRNTLIYLFSNILRGALPFLLLPFLVRALGPQQYGMIGLVTAAFGLLLPVVGLGTHAYIRTLFHRSSAEEMQRMLTASAYLLFASTVVLLLLVFALSGVVTLPLPLLLLIVGALAAFGEKVVSIRLVLWQMAGRPGAYGLLSVGMTLANLLLSIGLVFIVGLQADGRILGMWLPAALAGPVILVLMWRSGLLVRGLALPRREARQILRFGVPLIPHSLALLAIVFVERAVLSSDANGLSLGVFFAAFQLAMPIAILARSINLQFRAWSDQCMAQGEHLKVVRGSYAVMGLLLIAAIAYAWLLGFFYADIVGEEMASGYSVAVILVFSALLRGCYLVVVKGIFFSGRTRPLMVLTVTLSVLFSLLLLTVSDLYSLAWLNLCFNFALFICVWLLAAKLQPQPWLSFLGRAKVG